MTTQTQTRNPMRTVPSEDLKLIEVPGRPGKLTGTVVKYGDVAVVLSKGIVIRESVAPRAFQPFPQPGQNITAVIQHERSRAVAALGYDLALFDSPSALRAEITLPNTTDGRDAAELYRQGVLTGLSAEFKPVHSIVQGGILVRRQAVLIRVSLVDQPAYPGSMLDNAQAEAREAEKRALLMFPAPERKFWAF